MRRTASLSWTALRRGPLTARWIFRACGTPAVVVGTEVAVVAAAPQLLQAAEQHPQQARRLVERVPRPVVELAPRQQGELVPHRQRAELRRLVDHRRLAALVVDRRRLPLAAVGAAEVISPAAQTRMAPLILDSEKWPAMPTACRR